ncbi:MAG: efflux RND transporter periplasmic adaptor subunit [Candidatus Krumholzibacteriia bacterium]
MKAGISRRTRNGVVVIVVILALAVVFSARYRSLGRKEAPAGIRAVQDQEGIPVETVTVRRGDLAAWITLAGTVEGVVQYPIVSNNALKVVGIPVKEGDRVVKGDVIIRLASGAPSPMYHSLDKSRANYQNAQLEVQRLRNLYAEGAVARADLDAAETKLKILAADLQDAEGSILLTADEPGVVTSILVNEGDTVKTGKALAWIADTSSVKVVFEAGSRQALSLATGQVARWTDPAGEAWTGSVQRLDLMADSQTHLLEGEALFPNPQGRLVPGLLISFMVRTEAVENALIVPAACLVDTPTGPAVWTADDQAHLVSVKTGLKTGERVEITSGLSEGQAVVLHGGTLLSEGVKIKTAGTGEGR